MNKPETTPPTYFHHLRYSTGRYVDCCFRAVDGTPLIARRAAVAHVIEGTNRVYNMLPRMIDLA